MALEARWRCQTGVALKTHEELPARDRRKGQRGEAGKHGEDDTSWPYTEQELTALLGPAWVPSRRFGTNEGGKTRPLDEYSESLRPYRWHDAYDRSGKVAAAQKGVPTHGP